MYHKVKMYLVYFLRALLLMLVENGQLVVHLHEGVNENKRKDH